MRARKTPSPSNSSRLSINTSGPKLRTILKNRSGQNSDTPLPDSKLMVYDDHLPIINTNNFKAAQDDKPFAFNERQRRYETVNCEEDLVMKR